MVIVMILTILLLVNLMEVIVVVELTKNIALFVNVWNLIMVALVPRAASNQTPKNSKL